MRRCLHKRLGQAGDFFKMRFTEWRLRMKYRRFSMQITTDFYLLIREKLIKKSSAPGGSEKKYVYFY